MKTTQEIKLSYQDYSAGSGLPARLWFVKVKITTRDENSEPPNAFVQAVESCYHTTEHLEDALESVRQLSSRA